MKKIHIFLGSSIIDLHEERLEIESFINGLNNKYIDQGIYIYAYACEETSGAMVKDGSQSVHDKYITENADATFFMFFHKAGEFTLHELELARNTFLSNQNKPNVFVFFKTIGIETVDNDEIKATVDKIANEYAHYYKTFEKADTVKLEILQYILDLLPQTSELIIKDGNVLVDNVLVDRIDATGILAYKNNPELKALKEEIEKLNGEVSNARAENDLTRMHELSTIVNQKQDEYYKLEAVILNALKTFYNYNKNGEQADPILMSALRLVEVGKVDEALSILPSLNQIKHEVDKEIFYDEISKVNKQKIIEKAEMRIKFLKMKKITAKTEEELWKAEDEKYDEIHDLYYSTYPLAKKAENISFLLDFADYCLEWHYFEDGIDVAKRIEYIYSDPDKEIANKDKRSLLHLLGMMYGQKGDLTNAESSFYKLIDMINESKDLNPAEIQAHIADVYHALAFIYSNNHNNDKAERCYLDAINKLESLNDSDCDPRLAHVYHNLATIYYELGYDHPEKYDYSVCCNEKALKIFRGLADSVSKEEYEPCLAMVYNSLGNCYSYIEGHKEAAKSMYLKAKEIAEKYRDNNRMCAFLMAGMS